MAAPQIDYIFAYYKLHELKRNLNVNLLMFHSFI